MQKLIKKVIISFALIFTLSSTSTIDFIPVNAHAKTTYVWIAPSYGKKWHYRKDCRGLNAAKSFRHVSLHWARSHHYKHCKWG